MTKPKGITASELVALDLPEPRWAVEGIVPEGVSLLVSRPKLGKSFMALDLAVAVATGGKALGRIPVETGEALGVFLEDNQRRLQSRLLGLLDGAPAPKALHLFTEWPRADKGGLEDMDAWLTDHPQTRIGVIDTLARFRPTHQRFSSSQYAQDYDALAGLQTLAGRHRVAILVLHHDRKLAADDWIDRISGTLGLSGAADGLLGLFRPRGAQDGTLKVTGRDIEESELAVQFDAGKWTLIGDAAMNVSPERRQVIDLLAENPPMTPSAIASTLGKNPSTVRTLLQRLNVAGLISKRGSSYTLPSRAVDGVDSVDRSSGSVVLSTASTVLVGDSLTDAQDQASAFLMPQPVETAERTASRTFRCPRCKKPTSSSPGGGSKVLCSHCRRWVAPESESLGRAS